MQYTYYIYYGQYEQLKLYSVDTFDYYMYLPLYLSNLKPENLFTQCIKTSETHKYNY